MAKTTARPRSKKTNPTSISKSIRSRKSPSRDGIPSLCFHKATGYACVYLNGECHYLGAKYGTEKAQRNYDRLIQGWLANGRMMPNPDEVLSITELCAEGYLFSPKDSEQERHSFAEVHRRPDQKPNPRKTDRTLGDCYTTASYRKAIKRACTKAEIPPWSPNQLRHNAATLIRKNYGLDVAQVILGHSSADITQVYAEVDKIKAMKVISEVG